MFFVATAAILKFLSLKIMCTHVKQNFWKVSPNNCKNTQFNTRASTTLKSEGEVTSLSGADEREVRDNREKW
jgi:hypothetical protein